MNEKSKSWALCILFLAVVLVFALLLREGYITLILQKWRLIKYLIEPAMLLLSPCLFWFSGKYSKTKGCGFLSAIYLLLGIIVGIQVLYITYKYAMQNWLKSSSWANTHGISGDWRTMYFFTPIIFIYPHIL